MKLFGSDNNGVTYVEYAIVLTLVGVVAVLAVTALGWPLWNHYRFSQLMVILPIP